MPTPPVRVLLIDGDAATHRRVRRLLTETAEQPFELDWVSTHEEGAAAVAHGSYDVFLLDYEVGTPSGLEILNSEHRGGSQPPIIVLTRQLDDRVDVEAMKAGAADYLVTDALSAAQLKRSIRHALERQRLLAELNRERYLLHTLMDNVPDNIYFKDSAGRFIRINRAKARRSGLNDPAEAIGKTDFDFFPRQHALKARADEQQVMETGEPVIGLEERLTWPNGRVTWVSTTKVPFRDEDGKVIGTLGISRDITHRIQQELALREAKEAAEAASRAKSDFLANMSHEIRTPLNAVIGMTELVLETDLTNTQRDYLMLVRESGEVLLELINDILDFSKIESGKLQIDAVPFRLRESLGDTMKSLALRAHGKKLELACHIASDVPDALLGDIGRLRQILINLVGNAIKFTQQGEVVARASVESPDPLTVHFSVSDTGIGIPADKQKLIFEAFEQADGSTTRQFGGTGLGLAICKSLVERMGGRIWLESEVGRGSTFHFTIQLPIDTQASDERPRIPSVAVQDAAVLVVDDNATNRLIIREILQSWGMKPTVVSGAAEALSALCDADSEGRRFGLLISDVNMPGMDGFALVEKIRKSAALAGTAVIMLTSGDRPDDPARCEALNITSHLMKPIKQSELFDAVVQVLDKDRGPGEVSATVAGTAQTAHLPQLRILLAEDSLVNQKLAVGLLERHGQIVLVANNGREALQLLQTQDFDLVLMDVQMPEMDGYETTTEIRRREQATRQHVPIIAMTAHAMKGDREKCLASGMDGYIAKPVRVAELLLEIQNVGAAIAAARTVADAGQQVNWSA